MRTVTLSISKKSKLDLRASTEVDARQRPIWPEKGATHLSVVAETGTRVLFAKFFADGAMQDVSILKVDEKNRVTVDGHRVLPFIGRSTEGSVPVRVLPALFSRRES